MSAKSRIRLDPPQNSLTAEIKAIFELILVNIQYTIVLATYLFVHWVILIPLKYVWLSLYVRIEDFLYYCLQGLVISTSWWTGTDVIELGADITKDTEIDEQPSKVVMIANHQSYADALVVIYSFVPHSTFKTLWVVYEGFKYLTSFGWVSITHGDFFIAPKVFKPNDLANHCLKKRNRSKNCIFIFPEGSLKKNFQKESDELTIRKNLPQVKYVIWPKSGAFLDVVCDERIGVTHVVDVTIIFPHLNYDELFLDLFLRTPKEPIYLLYKVFKIQDDIFSKVKNTVKSFDKIISNNDTPSQSSETQSLYVKCVPRSELKEHGQDWLNRLWFEKDQNMEFFYTERENFLKTYGPPRPIQISYFLLFYTHLVYAWLTLFMFFLLYRLYIII